jgi:hypothetical protein
VAQKETDRKALLIQYPYKSGDADNQHFVSHGISRRSAARTTIRQARGLIAISRWLSAATPPVRTVHAAQKIANDVLPPIRGMLSIKCVATETRNTANPPHVVGWSLTFGDTSSHHTFARGASITQTNRWCRCVQPPSKGYEPSGVEQETAAVGGRCRVARSVRMKRGYSVAGDCSILKAESVAASVTGSVSGSGSGSPSNSHSPSGVRKIMDRNL